MFPGVHSINVKFHPPAGGIGQMGNRPPAGGLGPVGQHPQMPQQGGGMNPQMLLSLLQGMSPQGGGMMGGGGMGGAMGGQMAPLMQILMGLLQRQQ